MRLINTQTLSLCEYQPSILRYAILSHTWQQDETTFHEMMNPTPATRDKAGFVKIKRFCQIAAEYGFRYGWVDTCCIDKTNPTELSEAINSMFLWYKNSHLCVAYLSDVEPGIGTQDAQFARSRWFTRGWTLQELIAPSNVEFYGSKWDYIDSKLACLAQLEVITGIHEEVLAHRVLSNFSIATKMSWASGRKTTRKEDVAYCLLGIFDVNMPLLYGEGDKAFTRLQEEIMKGSDDQSLFSWEADPRNVDFPSGWCSVFAPAPSFFNARVEEAISSSYLSHFSYPRKPYSSTNMGIYITLPIVVMRKTNSVLPFETEVTPWHYAVLDCHIDEVPICIPVEPVSSDQIRYQRGTQPNLTLDKLEGHLCKVRDVYIHHQHTWRPSLNEGVDAFHNGRWSTKALEKDRVIHYLRKSSNGGEKYLIAHDKLNFMSYVHLGISGLLPFLAGLMQYKPFRLWLRSWLHQPVLIDMVPIGLVTYWLFTKYSTVLLASSLNLLVVGPLRLFHDSVVDTVRDFAVRRNRRWLRRVYGIRPPIHSVRRYHIHDRYDLWLRFVLDEVLYIILVISSFVLAIRILSIIPLWPTSPEGTGKTKF